jgi:hypothetical protein
VGGAAEGAGWEAAASPQQQAVGWAPAGRPEVGGAAEGAGWEAAASPQQRAVGCLPAGRPEVGCGAEAPRWEAAVWLQLAAALREEAAYPRYCTELQAVSNKHPSVSLGCDQ